MGQEFNSAFFLANGPWFKPEGKCCNYKHQEVTKYEEKSKDDCKQMCLDDVNCRAYENIKARTLAYGEDWDCNIFHSDEEFDHSVSCVKTNDKNSKDECHTKGKVSQWKMDGK